MADRQLTYKDEGDYTIQIGDHILFMDKYEGQITGIKWSSQTVTIRYLDFDDAKRNGDPRVKTARTGYKNISLERRDG